MNLSLYPISEIAVDDKRLPQFAWHDGQFIESRQFCAEVARNASAFSNQTDTCYALYIESAYPFAVMLFALWHAGKNVAIPGSNRPATADYLLGQGYRLLGEWPERETQPLFDSTFEMQLRPLNTEQTALKIFTSGSSGEPKILTKTITQLQAEAEMLERQWSQSLANAAAIATVSHQHMYGLLFRLIWPLAARRCFYSPMFLSPEPMLKVIAAKPAYWVASPAQLKRLDELSPWQAIHQLTAIFSSGGPLPKTAAQKIAQFGGLSVNEIYGSSETGAVAFRHTVSDQEWTPLPGVTLFNEEGRCRISTPSLPASESVYSDDKIRLISNGRFMLSGRLDRIVKIEEKRISLDEMEERLCACAWVNQCHCLMLTANRDLIGALVVLSEPGVGILEHQNRTALIRNLRQHLLQAFDAVVVPRKWLFLNTLPTTPQSKIDSTILQELLQLDSTKFPKILYCRLNPVKVELMLRIQQDLIYFDGHFPARRILPGVAQLAWVDYFGKLFFYINQPFLTMEVIKFKKIIEPEALITMTLDWNSTNNKLYFSLASATDSHSSGRMAYGKQP